MTKLESRIRNSIPFRFLAERSKKIILPGFRGVPLYDVLKFFFVHIKKSSLTERAAAISYNFIMAIPPTCLFLFTLIPQLLPKKTIKIQLHILIKDIIPADTYNKGLMSFVDSFLGNDSKTALLSFGFLLLLFFASNGMMGIMRSFNKNYIGFQKRTGLEKRWTAIRLTLLIMGLLFACLLLLIMQGALLKWLGIKNLRLLKSILVIRWVLIINLIFYSIAFIYKYAPAVKWRWKLVSPGSILATSLSIIATVGFSIFVNNFGKYNALYGSIGTIIVI
ncbi:MAG: YihY/virulence factor BrkB family protein, partial [Bacteroidetes bacterium]|nr:YihY/virulence factor BrkB family protein [Bacteroidota bacterium]